jgi:transposase
MTKLADVSREDLEDALSAVESSKPTQRLMVAILYKAGPSVPMIADWFEMRERTIYDWFDRMETMPLEDAIHDDDRPGRPPKLTAEQRTAFADALHDEPTAYGYENADWSPAIAREFLVQEFGVEYTRRHVRRLMDELTSDDG